MNDQLLIKYLLNETDQGESMAVKEWLAEHRDHHKQFEQIQRLWETGGKVALGSQVDENAAWERFVLRRDKVKVDKNLSKQRWIYPAWMKIAATVTLLLVIGWTLTSLLPHKGKALYATVVLESAMNSRKEVLLDGSTVTLNRNSGIAYAQKLMGGQRLLSLTAGEAYFDIAKNQNKPFIIEAQNVKITVLGTAFNVRQTATSTTVIVDSGSVGVMVADNQIVLTPDEKAVINHKTGSIQKSFQDNALFRYYVTNKFIAEDVGLPKLITALNEAYGASIEIASERARGLSITTTLEYGSLENNLVVIKETLGLSITKSGNRIILE